MNTLPLRPAAWIFLPLLAACGAAAQAPAAAPECPQAPAPTPAPAVEKADLAYRTPEVDGTPPVALDDWRAVQKLGTEAIRAQNLDERISQCRAFLAEHGEHQAAKEVLDALIDALIEQENFDAPELGALVERRVALGDEGDFNEPGTLLEKYHIKHDLPLKSGLRVIAAGRKRLAAKLKQLEWEESEDTREYKELQYRYVQAELSTLEARLYLDNDQPQEALAALDKARENREKVDKGLRAQNQAGDLLLELHTGLMDYPSVIEAAAHLRLGDRAHALANISQTLGFFSDLEVRKIYEATQKELGLPLPATPPITAEPEPAQVFTLKDLDGKKVKLSSFRGKVVLIAFFAHWCGPCKRELPELLEFARANKKSGVELLAISVDDFEDRPKIKPFLEENNLLGLHVLLRDPEQLSSYNFRGVPSLYVVDRKGKIAHARTGYDPDLKEKLANEISKLVAGGDTPGRDLLSIEQAPSGFGLLWKHSVDTDARAIAIAPPLGDGPGEVGVLESKGLQRWSATGKSLGTKPVTGWVRSLRAADLDGNGSSEWIVGGWNDLKVLDHEGELYWKKEVGGALRIAGVRDLDGDGFQEIVIRAGDRATAMKAIPKPFWRSPRFKDLDKVVLAPDGPVVQADDTLTALTATGKKLESKAEVPEGMTLAARVHSADGSLVDYFEGRWGATPVFDYDVDGDGKRDIVLLHSYGVIAFDQAGKPILRVRSHDLSIEAALGDLDGKPGAELAIFVEHFGVVVLGKK